jgi:hypothetical protein
MVNTLSEPIEIKPLRIGVSTHACNTGGLKQTTHLEQREDLREFIEDLRPNWPNDAAQKELRELRAEEENDSFPFRLAR